MPIIERGLQIVGALFLYGCTSVGSFVLFLWRTIMSVGRSIPFKRFILACNKVGFESIGIVVLTGTSAGMVFALQTYVGFQRIGGEQFIGLVVALGVIREMGPMLTGLMVTGRAGSAIAAEIGTMRITEQIDALQTIGINPLRYLVAPYVMAGVLMLPCLTVFSMVAGLVGGYISTVYLIGLSADDYLFCITSSVMMFDIIGGLIKAACFGLLITWVSTYKGFFASDGARGVGLATTQTVVTSSVLILICDYFITKFLEL